MSKVLGFVRRRVEGAVFLLMVPFLLAARLATSGSKFHVPSSKLAVRRWITFIALGLQCWREMWWVLLRHEPAANVWRYLFLLERADALNARVPAHNGGGGLLVCAPGHIGDLLHTMPMLRAVRRQQPGLRITLLVGPWCEGLARSIPYADDAVVWAPHFVQYARAYLRAMPGMGQEMRLIRELRERRFDTLITTVGTDPAILLLALGIRPRMWVGVEPRPPKYAPLEVEKMFDYDTRQYEAERMLALAEPLGVTSGDVSLEFPLTAADEAAAAALLREHGIADGEAFAVVAPGAGWPGKIWPAERFGEIAHWLRETMGLNTVLLGAPGEERIAQVVAAHVPMRGGDGRTDAVVNLVGKVPIGVSAAVVKRACVWIGNDNALLHVAAAFGVPTVALFGPTRPEKWAPRGERHRSLRRMEACYGCYPWHPRAACVADGLCMRMVPVSEVQDAVAGVLAQEMAAAKGGS